MYSFVLVAYLDVRSNTYVLAPYLVLHSYADASSLSSMSVHAEYVQVHVVFKATQSSYRIRDEYITNTWCIHKEEEEEEEEEAAADPKSLQKRAAEEPAEERGRGKRRAK